MSKPKTRPRPGGTPMVEAASITTASKGTGERPTDGYAWQRYAREQTIPADVARACKSDPKTAKLVYLTLSTYVGPDGTAEPGQKALARQTGCSASSLGRAVAALEAAGLLTIERHRRGVDSKGKNRTNLHTLTWEASVTTMTNGHSYDHRSQTGDHRSQEGGPSVTP